MRRCFPGRFLSSGLFGSSFFGCCLPSSNLLRRRLFSGSSFRRCLLRAGAAGCDLALRRRIGGFSTGRWRVSCTLLLGAHCPVQKEDQNRDPTNYCRNLLECWTGNRRARVAWQRRLGLLPSCVPLLQPSFLCCSLLVALLVFQARLFSRRLALLLQAGLLGGGLTLALFF